MIIINTMISLKRDKQISLPAIFHRCMKASTVSNGREEIKNVDTPVFTQSSISECIYGTCIF